MQRFAVLSISICEASADAATGRRAHSTASVSLSSLQAFLSLPACSLHSPSSSFSSFPEPYLARTDRASAGRPKRAPPPSQPRTVRFHARNPVSRASHTPYQARRTATMPHAGRATRLDGDRRCAIAVARLFTCGRAHGPTAACIGTSTIGTASERYWIAFRAAACPPGRLHGAHTSHRTRHCWTISLAPSTGRSEPALAPSSLGGLKGTR